MHVVTLFYCVWQGAEHLNKFDKELLMQDVCNFSVEELVNIITSNYNVGVL